jgi:hypothetical protein
MQNCQVLPLSGSEPIFEYKKWATGNGEHENNCYDYAFNSYDPRKPNTGQPGENAELKHPGITRDLPDSTTCRGLILRALLDNPGKVKVLKTPCTACPKGYYKVVGYTSGSDFHWYRQNQGVVYRTCTGDTIWGLANLFSVRPTYILEAYRNRKRISPGDTLSGLLSEGNKIVRPPVRRIGQNDTRDVMDHFGLYDPSLIRYILERRLEPNKLMIIPCNVWSHKRGETPPSIVDARNHIIKNPQKANRNYGSGLNYRRFCSAFIVSSRGIHTGTKPM